MFAAYLLAASLFSASTPGTERERVLTGFFSPAPGNEVTISAFDLRNNGGVADVKKLRGFIEVNPPKGACLDIFRGETNDAAHVCTKTQVSFRLGDIDRAGKITWEVKTSSDDPGTVLKWQTPYRLAMIIARERGKTHPKADSEEYWRGLPPDYRFIQACNDLSNDKGRRLEIKFFTGESWRFYFPETHVLLPQPAEPPNLYISAGSQKRSVSEASQQAAEAPPPETPPPSKKPDLPDNTEDRKSWTVGLRGSYVMSSDRFHPDQSQTAGTRGLCRYNFSGPPDDPNTGRIECQDTPYFHMFLLPVTCIGAVKGDVGS